ncbi:sulfurtransferase TusA family protein [Bacillus sp. Bva_UNVM-123]|uniref:sulfurtransferase TusA family protein n=1 Tax=Bacillus sp. Bva_UNVM-123 TaxID=2829798 RepID=UPI00391F42CB
MNHIKSDQVVDAKGLSCPMPIVKTKKAITDLEAGQVLKVEATDQGSRADMQAWAKSSGHQYLGTIKDGDVLAHYVRKSSGEELNEKKYPHIATNEELERKLLVKDNIVVLDVREAAEYAFNHIPNALSIPLGELEEHFHELEKDAEIFVICRTGNRSDFAAQKLAEKGFGKVMNVIPGMSEWSGRTVNIQGEEV